MTAAGNASSDAAARTADDLLSMAERLFAADGVENVALTQIVAQSGQKNRSALHYHFGSRGGVLTAVLNRRLDPINARREALLAALADRAPALDVVRAVIAPLGMAVVEEPWGADYMSVLAQVIFHPQLLGERGVEEALLSGMRHGRRRLAAIAPDLPEPLMQQRFTWLTDSVVFALARWVRDTAPSARTPDAMAELIEQLCAYGAAGLTAPVPKPQETAP